MAGKVDEKDSKTLTKIVLALKKRGAEGIILGCTELPLVFSSDFNMPVFNSLEILARALLQKVNK
ncbi:MAG: hypothetical protein A3C30_03365 [Candidatus Levybacteria bacterium RIFCSPHIGHO2_02_FULL_40_18]|nr:MAG: hypothetical protein A2869_01875 [Candidatus Levybacteria bacterium RIFCSPHIGHO2_01_FULL_40_58]OGH26129.1 MAG: hypothetical protein A3C30_03365 [Candidatus Levybacteria bacterium RIFCSPHIGHO2_02_FULL_40_18]OGH31323.1 MAG: hypothetical protein A3E43_03140 [Candidatus Levybacteria bacterium RIFCSPHIGHO2_12_FULL_40_31]OGH39958.1 MAG: hypothetical protein A2894_02715 [Candidatus Levybacteria bacterium RIFCSPLOWO2_01_FULL_40_64]OGH49604.1 MAG: hypothetical protein A3I54_05150 [Candidatus Lev